MTERLYYTDCYLREFAARVVERSADGRTVYLDRTLFYPASGGQPFDVGSIDGVKVVEVVDEEERIAHRLAAPLASEGAVAGEIDWTRRFDHMQQHSGQHLLSAVFEELFGLHTVSFHLGAESATIDLEGGPVEARTVVEAERRANQEIDQRRQKQEAAYHFMSAMAGNLESFEEASRALFANDHQRFIDLVAAWPPDIRDHAAKLAFD